MICIQLEYFIWYSIKTITKLSATKKFFWKRRGEGGLWAPYLQSFNSNINAHIWQFVKKKIIINKQIIIETSDLSVIGFHAWGLYHHTCIIFMAYAYIGEIRTTMVKYYTCISSCRIELFRIRIPRNNQLVNSCL